jgi:hypothetical protein
VYIFIYLKVSLTLFISLVEKSSYLHGTQECKILNMNVLFLILVQRRN